MYAIVEIRGKQYPVREGDVFNVDLLEADGEMQFDKVLMVHDGNTPKVGHPHLPKCSVHVEVIGMEKGPKVIAFKYKRCKNYRLKRGHRQKYSQIRVKKIVVA